MANIKCTIHHLGRIFISLDEKKINKQTNERTISNPCFRYKRQMKIFFAPSFNIYLLFMRYCMYSMVVCFLFSTSVRSHLMRSLCFHVLLPSPIHWFESVFLSKLFSWIYWFATSSAFSPIIISASFIFVFIFFLLFFRLVLSLLLLLLFFFPISINNGMWFCWRCTMCTIQCYCRMWLSPFINWKCLCSALTSFFVVVDIIQNALPIRFHRTLEIERKTSTNK